MARFKWGHSFLSLNEGLLERYSECATAVEVIQAQQEYLDSLARGGDSGEEESEDEREGGGYLRSRDLPPTDSDEYERTEDENEEEGGGDKEIQLAAEKLAHKLTIKLDGDVAVVEKAT